MEPRPIRLIRHPLDGRRVRVPASKSVANREFVLSALADGRSRVRLGPLDPGDDVRAMREAIERLGYGIRDEGDGTYAVTGGVPQFTDTTIDAREAATVSRFAAVLAALADRPITIDGAPRLRERPHAPLLRALRELGAKVEGDRLPVTIQGPITGGEIAIPGNESSQFASALLLAGARMPRGLRLRITGSLVSAPFVALTAAAIAARGVRVERPAPNEFVIAPQRVGPRDVTVPSDASAASYPAAAAAILGGSIALANVDPRPSEGEQGDTRVFELLRRMGCAVHRAGRDAVVSRTGALYGITENVNDCSDIFPTLAVVATQGDTPTELSGIAHTRRQESDRIAVVAAGIAALGGCATAYADSIRIEPSPLHQGVVDSAGDHRVAMAFAILGLQVPGVAIAGAEAVSKTFPSFFEMVDSLGR